MKSIKIVILFLIFWSCSKDKYVTDFDETLGPENSQTLTELVTDFETDFLKRQYPKLKTENAYEQFLTELRDGKTEDWKKISEKARKIFKSSDLKNEIYRYPDSVWIVENSSLDKKEDSLELLYSPVPYIKSRYKYDNPDGTFEYLYSRNYPNILSNMDTDSIIKSEMKTPEFNTIGKYIQAIYQIKERDTFFNNFYRQKQNGFIRPETLAKVILYQKVDLNDYLVKRIIVLEIAY
ncbi:hypothetical protein [Ulvibacter litoralis]|uniref:Uncharacterized protein n=1 Tax=Ulvibacter litoralis TaxID=227084 RepID=A0A1G7JQN4_9FLAO|nr:hypothetical protein [Ulvibacter litoralis]GHC65789.1 hypothetical protein GCM10008083_33690 [Ulvibacter litoralis]SDF27181.1 hypothetical protein SAMN05421855_1243 [Ulvibacter litoralis]